MLNPLSGIKEGIDILARDITQGIKDIFVTDEDYLTTKVTALRQRFAFADSIIGTVNELTETINATEGTQAPKISIDLTNVNNGRYGTGKVTYLDMAWYAPYKAKGDAFISSVMWLGFLWVMFIHLPSIISGGSSGVTSAMPMDNSTGNLLEDKSRKGGRK